MAAHDSVSSRLSQILTEEDIPGASLQGRNPTALKSDELPFWLKCRGDPAKGLKTKAQLAKRVLEYVASGRDKDVVDPDKDLLYTRRKERQEQLAQSDAMPEERTVKFPSAGWSTNLQRMPLFTRAEMDLHISKSGKNLDKNKQNHAVPTSMKKAKTFLVDEYLKDLTCASDDHYFFFKCLCYHSFKKIEPPHKLQVSLCLVTGAVKYASCTCVAGTVGFCNHVLAVMMKL